VIHDGKIVNGTRKPHDDFGMSDHRSASTHVAFTLPRLTIRAIALHKVSAPEALRPRRHAVARSTTNVRATAASASPALICSFAPRRGCGVNYQPGVMPLPTMAAFVPQASLDQRRVAAAFDLQRFGS
jgi:hypothetical protein